MPIFDSTIGVRGVDGICSPLRFSKCQYSCKIQRIFRARASNFRAATHFLSFCCCLLKNICQSPPHPLPAERVLRRWWGTKYSGKKTPKLRILIFGVCFEEKNSKHTPARYWCIPGQLYTISIHCKNKHSSKDQGGEETNTYQTEQKEPD